jgi:type VI secretion system protein ImpL
MSSFRRLYRSHWFRTGFAVLVVMVLVWFLGALLGIGQMHPLETEIARIITIIALFVLWLISNLLQDLSASRCEKALVQGITEPTLEAKAAREHVRETEKASAEEVAALTERLQKAMQTLRKSKLGGSRRQLSAMPWYMIIGPPGAGKTTALQNCGLRFPLDDGKTPIGGVGGTRNCEWMFADEAVLIDTAGRYATQDNGAEVDSAGWIGFLSLLKKHRPRQPLNGVLVAISLSDLATQSDTERSAHARAIRHRIRELHDRLGLRLPLYVLFTKADLIAGFTDFFESLGREEREQVWGMTFPVDDSSDEDGSVAGFPREFDLLLARLNDRSLERMQQEPDIRRRRLIYGFPQQLMSMRDIANDFLIEAFHPSRLEARPLLRGVYFTSGTQEGRPIDRLLGVMASEFGLSRQTMVASGGIGRSYFLARLLRDVIFAEAPLAGLDPKVERRARWASIAAYAACSFVILLFGGTWLGSYLGNQELISQVHAGAASYNLQIAELQRRGPADQDLAAIVAPLDTLRNMRVGYNERDLGTPVGLTFGLYQGTKLSEAAQNAYVTTLNRVLLPRLLTRVEARLVTHLNNVDFLYQDLKVYLILGGQGPLDRGVVVPWLQGELLATYPTEEQTPLREALAEHADALLRQPVQRIAVNEDLIRQARAVLTREPLAEYSYNRLMRSKNVVAMPAWTVAEHGGPGVSRAFQLRSGKGLDSGVSGIYTRPGYNEFLQKLITLTQDISEDSWVLGRPKRDVKATIVDTANLRRDVLGLYYDDYVRKWDALIADIQIRSFNTIPQTLDLLSLLSAPASPLRDLLLNIDAQTQLSRPSSSDAAVAAAQARAAKVGDRLTGFAAFEARAGLSLRQNEMVGILSDMFGVDPNGKPTDPAKRVDEHFRNLHDFVTGTEAKPSGLETTIQGILTAYQSLNQGSGAQGQIQAMLGTPGGNGGAATQMQELTRNTPPEIANMLAPVGRNAVQVAATGAAQELSDAWRSQILPLCEAAFNRYPFVAASADDVPMDDFAQLLGPAGKIEGFFNQYLKPFVDTTQRPWRWQSPDRAPIGVSPASLTEFERAAQIRDGLFNNGSSIQVRFQLTPVSLDQSIGQVSIDIGGQGLTYAHGPLEAQAFTWPGPSGKTTVRVTITPISGGNAKIDEYDDPWSLLRLLDGRITGGAQPDKFRVAFSGSAGSAVFDLTASSVRNPFTLGALRSFHCPAKL